MTIRWGILGAARIAEERVLPAMSKVEDSAVAVIASRGIGRAQSLVDRFGGRAVSSYDELLAAPDIDAVYVPQPNHLHVAWATRALEAGKHVLVEKPATLTSAAAQELVAVARRHDRLLVEAFMYRFHPQWAYIADYVRSQLADGSEGALIRAQMGFHIEPQAHPDDYRLIGDYGGGALLDVGCYPVDASTLLFGTAKSARRIALTLDGTDVDGVTVGLLEFGLGRLSTFEADFRFDRTDAPLEIRLADRVVIVDRPFYGDPGARTVRVLADGKPLAVKSYDDVNPYAEMVRAFGEHVSGGSSSEFATRQADQMIASATNRELLIAAG